MDTGFSHLPNPFQEDVVKEPRHVEASVPGLNDRALEEVCAAFDTLAAHPMPRSRARVSHSLMVSSNDAGYGKSHLLGRLFQRLRGRATLVYRNQLLNRETSWKTLLLGIVQELSLPEDLEGDSASDGTQLDRLARGLFAHLWASAYRNGKLRVDNDDDPHNSEETARRILADPDGAFAGLSPIIPASWFATVLPSVLPLFTETLERDGMSAERPEAWLKVLFAHTISPADPATRKICLEWLKGCDLEEDEARALGLRRADVPGWDLDSKEINDLCRNRIAELFRLGAAYRPFVLCFDQTDGYANEPDRAAHFGELITHLTDACTNLLTVLTSNRLPWQRIETVFHQAYRERISNPPITLDGITAPQAVALAQQRLAAADIPLSDRERFLAGGWIESLFEASRQMSVRRLLQLCRQRWKTGDVDRPVPLAEHYERIIGELLREAKRLQYDPNIFEWLTTTAAQGLPGVIVEPHIVSHRNYFPVRWTRDHQVVLFGFEDGSNNKRWQAIARTARQMHEAALAQGRTLKAVLFRTPEHHPIPGRWKIAAELNEAMSRYLSILIFGRVEIAEIYAAHNLYQDVLGGNLPPHGRGAALQFVQAQLARYWDMILAPLGRTETPLATDTAQRNGEGRPLTPWPSTLQPIPTPYGGPATGFSTRLPADSPSRPAAVPDRFPPELLTDVRAAARHLLFCDAEELAAAAGPQWPLDRVTDAARHIPEIRVHERDGETAYQWMS